MVGKRVLYMKIRKTSVAGEKEVSSKGETEIKAILHNPLRVVKKGNSENKYEKTKKKSNRLINIFAG